MIINTAPTHEAILSNVGQTSEFGIRNSAKAFNILSSGLYANKVRAIIRELSCNAVDSHIAAGKADIPFDIHLPNTLEPTFSIRDYGIGLSHEDVTKIYTTYFESTKTESNDFIGALGLGSKSPFSYTDNFTIVAIKDGRKGVYTAFINDRGVPSIALMSEEETNEASGVEIKFVVNDRSDFGKFKTEAKYVYRYFNLKPIVSGVEEFNFTELEYTDKDIIPGVHAYKSSYTPSYAIMGNIAYPIEIPDAASELGSLAALLKCNLEMHFDIGELDFQASREGLSYIPETIAAIKDKLAKLNDVLVEKLSNEASSIDNEWQRAIFLNEKSQSDLWIRAVADYINKNQMNTVSVSRNMSYIMLESFSITKKELASKWNIDVRGLQKSYGYTSSSSYKMVRPGTRRCTETDAVIDEWHFDVSKSIAFVVNDTTVGALERAKYHFSQQSNNRVSKIFVLDKVDKTKDIDIDGFLKAIYNPPETAIYQASSLAKKPRKSVSRDVSILQLERKNTYSWASKDNLVWRESDVTSDCTRNTKFYLALSGYRLESKLGYTDAKDLIDDVLTIPGIGIKGLHSATKIYGVRKKDISAISENTTWVNFEDYITTQLATLDVTPLISRLIRVDQRLSYIDIINLPNKDIVAYCTDQDCEYVAFANKVSALANIGDSNLTIHEIRQFRRALLKLMPKQLECIDNEIATLQEAMSNVNAKYPLLAALDHSSVSPKDIAEYINLKNTKKED